MRQFDRLYDSQGYEVMLFPMAYMNISQGEGGSYSHDLAMDFLGWDANGRVYQCPYYAPCTCKCVAHFGAGNSTWESVNPVHLPDGRITKVTFCFDHDGGILFPIGTIITQGDLIGHTGTVPSVGDHMHFNIAAGTYDGYEQVGTTGYYQLKNSLHLYDSSFVNDTVLVNDYGYNWQIYQGGSPTPTPEPTERHKFPWVLYANKFRQRTSV